MTSADRIIFTDFDGTITKRDSFIRSLIIYPSLLRILIALPGLILNLILYFFKLRSRNYMKAYSYSKLYSGIRISDAEKKFQKHYSTIKFNDKVIDLISEMKKEGAKVIVVSASPDVYMEFFLEKLGYDGLICTQVEKKGGIFTGALKGVNCIGPDKVKRILSSGHYNDNSYIIAIGNSKGDHDMLKLADEYYYVTAGVPVKNGKLI